MAYAARKSRFFIAFLAMIVAVLVLVPAADALTCASDDLAASHQSHSEGAHDHVGDADHDDEAGDGSHGACAHGHVHSNSGWHVGGDVSWASFSVGRNQPLFVGNDRWSLFSPDSLERPPRV